jgi:alkylation response protein AidB-like acyl-CoA dehydrogenase
LFNAVSDSDITTHYRLRARKQLINGGSRHELIILLLKCVYAAKADRCSAREADVHSLFWIKREKTMGKPNRWHTLPAPAADISEVHVSDLLVSTDHRIGSEGDGLTLIRDTLAMSRGGVAALAVGSLSKARDMVLTYARRRHLYGRPIAELGGVAGHITRLDAIERAATAASLRATAWVNACGVDAAPYTAVAKMVSCQLAEEGITEGRHVLGARALLSQLPYARLIGDVLLFGVFDGTSHIMLEELQMYLSKEVRARTSGLTRRADTIAEMRAVYALPMRSLAEVCRSENEFRPFAMLAHAGNVSRLSGTVSLRPVAELAQLLLAVTEEAKHRRKWGEGQQLRFALAEVYALIEVILGLIELFDPVRRTSFSAQNPGLRPVDDLGYRNALGWLGSRACSKLAECTLEAGLHPDPRGSREKGATPSIADVQASFLDKHDAIRSALAKALVED